MIKYFMRKRLFKEYDKESQDMLLKLEYKKHIIQTVCSMFWVASCMFQLIPVFIITMCEGIKLSVLTKIAIIAFFGVCFAGILVATNVFEEAMFGFTRLLAEKIYFLTCTSKGEALSKEDFELIRACSDKLYMFIASQMCKGYCFSICFEICRALQKGSIEFLAVRKPTPHVGSDDDGKNFTIHVIYVNNGWAFDTYSARQFPLDKLCEIYKAKVYKTFSYDEISGKSYVDFRDEHEPDIAEWSANNDCSMFFKGQR